MWRSMLMRLIRYSLSRSSARRQSRPRSFLTVEPLEVRSLLDATTLLIGTWNVDIADLGYRPPASPPSWPRSAPSPLTTARPSPRTS
jgi:hypothetical protein